MSYNPHITKDNSLETIQRALYIARGEVRKKDCSDKDKKEIYREVDTLIKRYVENYGNDEKIKRFLLEFENLKKEYKV